MYAAGAGKTVLATAVVDAIFEKHWAANVSISYFFCDFGNKNALEMETILGSWARQMLTSYGDIPPATEQKIQNILDGHLQSLSMDDLFSILVLAAELFKRNYLVLDGLDECADHVQLETASYLQRLLAAKTTVKVYLSSRPELKSLHVFKDVQKLSLGAISDRPEIEAYITEELMKRRNNRTLVVEREATMDKIRERFMEGANGM